MHPETHGIILFKVENRARLWHLVHSLTKRDDCGVFSGIMQVHGEKDQPLKPFEDIYDGDVLLPVSLSKHPNRNLIMRHLEADGLFFNVVDWSQVDKAVEEGGGGDQLTKLMVSSTRIDLDDIFDGDAKFPENTQKTPDDVDMEDLKEKFEQAEKLAQKILEGTDEASFTMIVYPKDDSKQPYAAEIPFLHGDAADKDRAVRVMSSIIAKFDAEAYSVFSTGWQYKTDDNGVPDKSNRQAILIIQTVHKSGASLGGTVEVEFYDGGRFKGFGKRTELPEGAAISGRFTEAFQLIPGGKAFEKFKKAAPPKEPPMQKRSKAKRSKRYH